jgi:hypothetical protein
MPGAGGGDSACLYVISPLLFIGGEIQAMGVGEGAIAAERSTSRRADGR